MSEKSESELRRQEVAARVTTPSKAAVTKTAILEAAGAFLEARPFRDLTVGALMRKTGHARPTFYQYFNDRHGLMETLLDDVKGDIIDGAQPWLAHQGAPVECLRRSLEALVEVGAARGSILRAISDAATSDARLELVWESFLNAFDEVVAARIAEDQARGLTPAFDPFPVAQALNRMDAGLLIQAFGRPVKAGKRDVLDAAFHIWVNALYPDQARNVTSKTNEKQG